MNTLQSSADFASLRGILNHHFPLEIEQVTLHRDMIGWVYIAQGRSRKYILKLYRPFDTPNALRSIDILQHLARSGCPVAAIIPTRQGGSHIVVDMSDGACVGILFDYVEGAEPDIATEMEPLARQVGRLHRLMDTFPAPLLYRGKDFYVDRYLANLRDLNYPADRIDELAACGAAWWSRLERLPRGFCHGDLHTGNMIQTGPGVYVLFDFDVASRTHSIIDVATLCDGSNFNHFHESAYDETLRRFERFYQGYRQERDLTGAEIAAIFDFIPVRHYEIIATITQCQGLSELSWAFLDEQYHWLLNWQNLIERKAR